MPVVPCSHSHDESVHGVIIRMAVPPSVSWYVPSSFVSLLYPGGPSVTAGDLVTRKPLIGRTHVGFRQTRPKTRYRAHHRLRRMYSIAHPLSDLR